MLSSTPEQRQRLWQRLTSAIETYITTVADRRVTPEIDLEALRSRIADMDFLSPVPPEDAVEWVADQLSNSQIHPAHPRYFGLFNPNPTTVSIAADALVAAFNPQLAAWGHNPFACEVEQYLVRRFAERLGYRRGRIAGSFTSGGAEANHTALLTALVDAFPRFPERGARELDGQPVLYVSEESHHSFVKAARLCGIGTEAVTTVPLDSRYVMDCDALADRITEDRRAGRLPFMVVATVGSTNAGLIDPVGRIAEIAAGAGIWLHADAAWGGAAALVPELNRHLQGIERADSITFDAHKWLSVPMGAGMFFTRHPQLPEKTFSFAAGYMPVTRDRDIIEPHQTTMQWSRRFIGLKVFMSLMVAGWEGYERAIRHQTEMGDLLREKLASAAWKVVNDTPLPTVCFVDARSETENSMDYLTAISDAVVRSGSAWISTTPMGGVKPVIRACITNYRTQPSDIDALVGDLNAARGRMNQ